MLLEQERHEQIETRTVGNLSIGNLSLQRRNVNLKIGKKIYKTSIGSVTLGRT